jgi:hypothetical protein
LHADGCAATHTGLPWLIASFYWETGGPNSDWMDKYGRADRDAYDSVKDYVASGSAVFVVKDDNLAFSVIMFSICACIALSILAFRRQAYGGELGGPIGPRKVSAFVM